MWHTRACCRFPPIPQFVGAYYSHFLKLFLKNSSVFEIAVMQGVPWEAGILGGKLATRTILLPKGTVLRLTLGISPVPCFFYIAVPCVRSSNAVNVCACTNFAHTCLSVPSISIFVTSFSSNSRWLYIHS